MCHRNRNPENWNVKALNLVYYLCWTSLDTVKTTCAFGLRIRLSIFQHHSEVKWKGYSHFFPSKTHIKHYLTSVIFLIERYCVIKMPAFTHNITNCIPSLISLPLRKSCISVRASKAKTKAVFTIQAYEIQLSCCQESFNFSNDNVEKSARKPATVSFSKRMNRTFITKAIYSRLECVQRFKKKNKKVKEICNSFWEFKILEK